MKKKPLIIAIVITFTLAMAMGFLFLKLLSNNSDTSPNSSITKVEAEDDNGQSDVDVSLQYAGSATLHHDERIITLNFTNPSKSKKSLSIDIVASIDGEDIVIAKTEKIRPGYKIDKVDYNLEKEIERGEYKGKFIVHFYDEKDQEEIVNSEIAIKVYVK